MSLVLFVYEVRLLSFKFLVSMAYPIIHCRNINGNTRETRTMEPFRVYRGHEAIVEDVAWHTKDPHIFGSVGDDQKLLMCVII